MTDVADTDAEQEADRDPDEEVADDDHDPEQHASESGDPETDVTGGPPDELVARVAAVDEEAAAEVETLRERITETEDELDDRDATIAEREETIEELESKLTRARADFQNYKKRAKQREEELRARATEELVERLLDVRDNLVRALEQDDDVEVREGVEATLATFDRVLDSEDVAAIEPDAGSAVEPERHEVVHRTESDEPEGAIAEVYRPGYEMAGKVLRPAQVTVSEGASEPLDESSSSERDDEVGS